MEFQENELQEMKENYCQELLLVGREGTSKLIEWLDENGFFTAPCSTQYHLSCEGGLLRHSLNVKETIIRLNNAAYDGQDKKTEPEYTSLILVALLHDIGKVGLFGKPNYIENYIKDGRPTKAEPEQKFKRSESKPYVTNPDLLYLPHAIRSVEIANRFISLTEDEEFAIVTHDGLYGEMKYVVNGHETPLYMLLHFSDLWCSRCLESEGSERDY